MNAWQERLRHAGAAMVADGTLRLPDTRAGALAARDGAAYCALEDFGVLAVEGADAEDFLQGQLTQDMSQLAADAWRYAAYCSPKGRMLANFIVCRPAPDAFALVLPASMLDSLRKRLAMFVLRSRVSLRDASPDFARLGVGGPHAGPALQEAGLPLPALASMQGAGSARVLALPGGRYLVLADPAQAVDLWDRLERAATPAGAGAWRWLTVEAGVPVVTPATADQFVPQAANWDALHGISFQKGCYTGQEIVARTQYLGRLKERLFLGDVEAPEPAAGTRLYSDVFGDQACGIVVSAAPAPESGAAALAVMQIAAAEAGVRIGSPSGPAFQPRSLPYPVPLAAPRARAPGLATP